MIIIITITVYDNLVIIIMTTIYDNLIIVMIYDNCDDDNHYHDV